MSVGETGFLWQITHYDMQKILCCLLEPSTVDVSLYHTSVCIVTLTGSWNQCLLKFCCILSSAEDLSLS